MIKVGTTGRSCMADLNLAGEGRHDEGMKQKAISGMQKQRDQPEKLSISSAHSSMFTTAAPKWLMNMQKLNSILPEGMVESGAG